MASFKSIIIVALVAAMAACTYAQLLQPIAGARDLTGGYYDNYSGQYSSAITGRVYNTAPAVVAAPLAHTWAGHAIAAPAVAAAPVAWIRR